MVKTCGIILEKYKNSIMKVEIAMKTSPYLEHNDRGTPDFPLELYIVNENHPRYNMQFHWHADIEIIRVLKGKLNLTLNNTHYKLIAGQSIIIPDSIVHGAVPEDCEYECLRFSKGILYATPEIKRMIKNRLLNPVRLMEKDAVEKLFSLMKQENLNQLTLMSYLYFVISEAMEKQKDTKIISEEKIERIKPAITYIEDNFQNCITVSQLARECLMSNNYFIKYFKEVTDQTPVEFLNRHRIEAACEMLLSGRSVTETAFSCGFNDLSYFIHVFKTHTSISPKKYIRQINML